MNTELIIKLETIINVLETIDVKGQANLLNLGGSIAALKELHDQLAQLEAMVAETKETEASSTSTKE